MGESFKYGLNISVRYIAVVAVIILIKVGIDSIVGNYDTRYSYFSLTYKVFVTVGLIASFLCGFFFPILLSRYISKYSSEYSYLPPRYLYEICRVKVLMKYFLNISWISFVLSLMFDLDLYPLLVCFLQSCGFISLFQYLKYRKRYKDL